MRVKTIILLMAVLAVILLFDSCTIINRSGETTDDNIPISDNISQDEEALESDEAVEEGAGSDIPDETNGETEDGLSDMIRVFSPTPGQVISSPLIIEGEARGTWFFEASFPVKLLDSEGNILVEYYAQTDQDWMTEDFVSFTSQIEFDSPGTETGTLILMKDNPSDLREYDAQIEIPVKFR